MDVKIRFSDRITHTEKMVEYMQKMANRLSFGHFRYGINSGKGSFNPVQDYLKRMKQEIRRYEETGNTEHLVNASNYGLLEFYNSLHPNAHFRSVDSHGGTE